MSKKAEARQPGRGCASGLKSVVRGCLERVSGPGAWRDRENLTRPLRGGPLSKREGSLMNR